MVTPPAHGPGAGQDEQRRNRPHDEAEDGPDGIPPGGRCIRLQMLKDDDRLPGRRFQNGMIAHDSSPEILMVETGHPPTRG